MNLPHIKRNGTSKKVGLATSAEFCHLFTREMKGLYLLSLLLTANHEKAEACFVSGLEDCIKGNSVFKERAHFWVKRMIVKNAIQAIAPRANESDKIMVAVTTRIDNGSLGKEKESRAMTSILALDAFERFVFVLSVLERYCDRDCALLWVAREASSVRRAYGL
jgi:hypothetical protein